MTTEPSADTRAAIKQTLIDHGVSNVSGALIDALTERLTRSEREAVAARYDFDGFGYQHTRAALKALLIDHGVTEVSGALLDALASTPPEAGYAPSEATQRMAKTLGVEWKPGNVWDAVSADALAAGTQPLTTPRPSAEPEAGEREAEAAWAVEAIPPAEWEIPDAPEFVVTLPGGGTFDCVAVDEADALDHARQHYASLTPRPSAETPPPTVEANEVAQLVRVIETRLLGVSPDDQDVQLEDDDWRIILSALRTQASHTDLLREAIIAVVNATRAYLPPDGIDAQECLNRILAATDNSEFGPIIAEIENGRA